MFSYLIVELFSISDMIDKIVYHSESLKTHSNPKSQKKLSSNFSSRDLGCFVSVNNITKFSGHPHRKSLNHAHAWWRPTQAGMSRTLRLHQSSPKFYLFAKDSQTIRSSKCLQIVLQQALVRLSSCKQCSVFVPRRAMSITKSWHVRVLCGTE